ncbi:hypothetical protein ABPG72_021842 [Tetrahymena utriculariae]
MSFFVLDCLNQFLKRQLINLQFLSLKKQLEFLCQSALKEMIKDKIIINSSDPGIKIRQFEFLFQNVHEQYPIIYKAFHLNEVLGQDLLALQNQNLIEIHFLYITKLNVFSILENMRSLPQSLQKANFYVSPYNMDIEAADLLFKNFLYLPKGILTIHVSMVFYDNQDNVSRFLIINLPKFNPRLQALKLNLSGFSNLLELSKKFDTLPQNLKKFKLIAKNIQLSPIQFATFAQNLSRLPQNLQKINIVLDEISSLEPIYQIFQSMPHSISNIKIKCNSAQYSNDEMKNFMLSVNKSFTQLKKLSLFFPQNLISQDSLNIMCKHLPPNLTKFYCQVSGYNTNDSLNVFPLNNLQKVYLDFTENYNSDDDIIDFFKRLYKNQNITHLHLTLNDEETDYKSIQFIIENLDQFPKQLKYFKLFLKEPMFKIDKIQIADNMLSKIPKTMKQFSIILNFKLSAPLLKHFISLYKQIDQLHLGIVKFNIKLNSRVFFTIQSSKINLQAFLNDILKEKSQQQKFYQNFIKLLIDTPPNFILENLTIVPLPTF